MCFLLALDLAELTAIKKHLLRKKAKQQKQTLTFGSSFPFLNLIHKKKKKKVSTRGKEYNILPHLKKGSVFAIKAKVLSR